MTIETEKQPMKTENITERTRVSLGIGAWFTMIGSVVSATAWITYLFISLQASVANFSAVNNADHEKIMTQVSQITEVQKTFVNFRQASDSAVWLYSHRIDTNNLSEDEIRESLRKIYIR